MSYDIHITRKAHWAEEHGPQISKDEWRHYVGGRADMRWMDITKWTPGDYCAELLDENDRPYGAIWWCKGELTTRRPEEAIVLRAMHIARDLNAVTMGDDGETYVDICSPSVGRPAYHNPSNLTNEWEEPPADYASTALRLPLQPNSVDAKGAQFRWTPYTIAVAAIVVLVLSSFLGNVLFSIFKFFLE
ncbi:MAG: hypothetical protein EAZ43_15280 [Betaproteobacteria bacterium]|nr:MAG: hypothetical protein EAZ43_15280 [Betaproteobacteria bacterium]